MTWNSFKPSETENRVVVSRDWRQGRISRSFERVQGFLGSSEMFWSKKEVVGHTTQSTRHATELYILNGSLYAL